MPPARLSLFSLFAPCNFGDVLKFAYDVGIAFAVMRQKADAAVLDAAFRVAEVPSAFVFERIQRTVAKQAIEVLRRIGFVARKVLALRVAEEGIFAFLRNGFKRVGFRHGFGAPFKINRRLR